MKNIKVWNLIYKKYNLKHENTCLKHDLWKISAPLSYWLLLCVFHSRVALAPCELKLWPRLHQWAKTPGFLMKHPWGECSKLLVDWVLGPMAGGNVGKSCGCCDDPCTPRDLNNSHTCHPTYPNIRPKDLVTENRGNHPGGCQQTLMLQPPKQPGPEFKFRLGPWHQRTTTTQILWSDGWAWLANRVGVMSTPGRTDMLKKPTRVTHQALLSDQGLNIVVVFAHLGPLQAEALQQLASVGQNIKVLGFKGEWTRRI